MNTIIKPMLAYKIDKKPIDWTKKVYMQPKLDGVRCVATKDGCYTRTGKPLMNVAHIELSLKQIGRASCREKSVG